MSTNKNLSPLGQLAAIFGTAATITVIKSVDDGLSAGAHVIMGLALYRIVQQLERFSGGNAKSPDPSPK